MESLYQQVLGERFKQLQPQLQSYFSLCVGSGAYGEGAGRFDVVGCPLPWLRPLLAPATAENTFFPEYGFNIPFRISNYAHLDPSGRSALTAKRSIDFPRRTRVFEDTTSLTEDGAVDYLGRHRRMLTDLLMEVTPDGHLRMISANSRLAAPAALVRLPKLFDTKAYMEQWWDAADEKFHIQTRVIAPLLGTVFVYAGSFDYRLYASEASLPRHAHPARWEARG